MARRRYALNDPELDGQVDALLEDAARVLDLEPVSDEVRQLVVTAVRLVEDGAGRGDLKLLNGAMKELRHALRVFAPYAHVRKVAVFGSARTGPDAPEYVQARTFAERMVQRDWMVITGAGDGIMGAAQGGAGRRASFGVNIRLPFEQAANETIAGDPKLINFRYFFTRKVTFVKESHAIALFPGGFGTLDEGFETLTLIQTGKSELVPVVFVDAPGGSYWNDWLEWVRVHMKERSLVGEHDFSLFRVTDDAEAAVREITGFYRNYHSSRWLGPRLIIRLQRAPDPAQVAELEADFQDVIVEGGMEVCEALPQERGEAGHLPRLVFRFDRRDVGRLRQLVDRLNALPGVADEEAEASPHELVALDIPDSAREEEGR